MNENEYFKTYNLDLKSSLKYMNFSGLSKDQLIEKYETYIMQRENQIRDIVIQSSALKAKLDEVNEKEKELNKQNEEMNSLLFKKDTQLKQLLTNKDIMFIKITNMVNENDQLRKNYRKTLVDSKGNKEKESREKMKRGRSSQIGERVRESSSIHSIKSNLNNKNGNIPTNKKEDNKEIEKKKNSDNSIDNKSTNNLNPKAKTAKKKPRKLLSECLHYDPVFK